MFMGNSRQLAPLVLQTPRPRLQGLRQINSNYIPEDDCSLGAPVLPVAAWQALPGPRGEGYSHTLTPVRTLTQASTLPLQP